MSVKVLSWTINTYVTCSCGKKYSLKQYLKLSCKCTGCGVYKAKPISYLIHEIAKLEGIEKQEGEN